MEQTSQVEYKYRDHYEVFYVNKLSQDTGELDEMMRSTLHNCFNLTNEEIDNMDQAQSHIPYVA